MSQEPLFNDPTVDPDDPDHKGTQQGTVNPEPSDTPEPEPDDKKTD